MEAIKKEQIVAAGIKLIEQKGYEKTSISEIVREAGVAQGTFYLYFSTKKELVLEIAATLLDEQFTQVKQAWEDQESLHEDVSVSAFIDLLVHTTYSITEERKNSIQILYSGIFLLNSFDKWEELYRPYYEWIAEQLKEAPIQMDKEALARLVVGTAEQAAEMYSFYYEGLESKEKSKQHATVFLKKALMLE